jgi:hypothetical protein
MGGLFKGLFATALPGAKPLTTDEAATSFVKVIHEAKLEDSASFYDIDGSKIPW